MSHEPPPSWARLKDGDAKASLALGAMNFGKRTDAAEAEKIVAAAWDSGIRVFDTANAYNGGESERILGRALRGKLADGAIIATKVGYGRAAGRPEGLSKARVLAAADESLKRLGTERIDLYYLHVPDHATPIEETLEAVFQLVSEQKIGSWGISNYASWQVLEMMTLADRAAMPRPVVAQHIYNLLIRQLDIEWSRFAVKYAIHTTVYNPLAGGLLAERWRVSGDAPPAGSRFSGNKLYLGRYWSDAMRALAAEYAGLAEQHGMTSVEFAYAWLAGAPGVDSILVGPGSVQHLEDAVRAVRLDLPPEARRLADAVHRSYLGTETTYTR